MKIRENMQFNTITIRIKLEEPILDVYKDSIIEYIRGYFPGAVQYKTDIESEVEIVMIDSIYFHCTQEEA